MKFKMIIACLGMLGILAACDTMSDYGNKMKEMVRWDGDDKYVVYFKSNSTALTANSENTLTEAMEAIRKDKVQKVRVVAYTDNKGSLRYNQQLSMRRAESIKKRLANSGAGNIEVSGAGEVPGDDGASGEKARRAEIVLMK
ncbi:MAG: OmpA family protein [Alphaproteobacteria bacterium]|nr:OmpA family protein [Alphaproteobacteria bacterium]